MIFNDANLTIIIEDGLWESSLLSASRLIQSAYAQGDNLTKTRSASAAPPLPAEPAPVEKTRDCAFGRRRNERGKTTQHGRGTRDTEAWHFKMPPTIAIGDRSMKKSEG